MTEVKGLGATLTWDGEIVTIKHRGLGSVTVPVREIIGVELSEPRMLHMGHLTLVSMSARHSGIMPKTPLTVPFGKRELTAFRDLYEALNQARLGTR